MASNEIILKLDWSEVKWELTGDFQSVSDDAYVCWSDREVIAAYTIRDAHGIEHRV